jgi:signal transduction histidine kinase
MNLSNVEKPRLLVVDDEESIRRICHRTLVALSCDVDIASNGAEALERFKTGIYDIVITDLTMPGGLDGRGLLEEIKRCAPLTDVIVMTAFPALENAIPILKQGAYDYLIKPFTPDVLRSVVARCLEKRRLSEDLSREKRLRQELEAAYGQLQEMENLKEAFLARVNHELRIPLAPSLMALDLLANSLSNSEHQELCGLLRRRLHQLQETIESILLFSSLKKPDFVCSKTLVDIQEQITEVIGNYQSLAKEKGLTLYQDFHMIPVPLLADPALLQTLFKNLLFNAIQFTPQGGTIRITLKGTPEQISIAFQDTGIGIPAEKMPRMFDSFYQVAHYLTREVGGLGLGLALSRRIAELHGGTIHIDSQEGKGSTFTVWLPMLQTPSLKHAEGKISGSMGYAAG